MVKLMIDPGHGGQDSGALGGGKKEKDLNLTYSTSLADYLRVTYVVDVLMTRGADVTTSLDNRTKAANNNGVNYFISLHVNSGGGTGFESYVYNGAVPASTTNRQMVIHDSIMKNISKFGVKDRGKKKADFHVLRETNMDALLIENLFIDNKDDLEKLQRCDFICALITGIGNGLGKALNLALK